MAGNTAILKHSPNVTGCALAIEKLLDDAGLPTDVFRSIVVAEADVNDITAALIDDDRVAAVSLTGSERAGAAVAASAGRYPVGLIAPHLCDRLPAGTVACRCIGAARWCDVMVGGLGEAR
jgi:acyl-CoA reductase-like NAD-dependent aldehyde dehydrogenase